MSSTLDFNAKEFLSMSKPARRLTCLRLARRAQELAEAVEPRYRSSYVDIANRWFRLADEVVTEDP